MIELSGQQQAALDDIERWYGTVANSQDGGLYRLFGYAGTGKTTIAKEVKRFVRKVQYGAFTGKAALVMQGKGCLEARTIHSMIYRAMDKSTEERDALTELLTAALGDPNGADDVIRLTAEIKQLNSKLQQPGFTLNPNAFIRKWDDDYKEFVSIEAPGLIVIDECSMVDKQLATDLLSFKIPVLVLGDPAQLPPVGGGGYFTGTKDAPVEPNSMLTEIHRQAAGNPVLQIATACRTRGMPNEGTYGDSKIVHRTDMRDANEWLAADQILCGKNLTRNSINRRMRQLRGFDGFLPNVGERVICLRNNKEQGLLNGSMWTVVEVGERPDDELYFDIKLQSLDDPSLLEVDTRAHKKIFLGQEFEDYHERGKADEFDFGHCITTHKAQGSEWENVIYIDEWPGSDRKKHQYTGVTRASKKITVVRW